VWNEAPPGGVNKKKGQEKGEERGEKGHSSYQQEYACGCGKKSVPN